MRLIIQMNRPGNVSIAVIPNLGKALNACIVISLYRTGKSLLMLFPI
jgi:hypothetical protein